MTTVKTLNEDVLYAILPKCSSTIDMWHFLLALSYNVPTMVGLRAFWSHIKLSSPSHTSAILFSFAKEVAIYCVHLRLDNLNWMVVIDLRRLLAQFRSLVSFHTGNVTLSTRTLIHDVKMLFPYLKYISLLVSLDCPTASSQFNQSVSILDDSFQEICSSISQITQLEHLSLVLQDKKGGCFSDQIARQYFRSVCEFISKSIARYTLVSIEENGSQLRHRFLSMNNTEHISIGPIHLSLVSTLSHLILSFRTMSNLDLILEMKDPTVDKLKLRTLVLPCIPLASRSIDILDLTQLRTIDIGRIDVKNRTELTRLDEILNHSHRRYLQNISLGLSEWQQAGLVVIWKGRNDGKVTTTATQFNSIFENCFDETLVPPVDETTSPAVADSFYLDFNDDSRSTNLRISLDRFWLHTLTNLNLTGIHCHSVDFQYIFDSLHQLRSLSITPCLLVYIDQFECQCSTTTTAIPSLRTHSLNRKLLSLNLVSHLSDMQQTCSILVDHYRLHCARHSSIHQHLTNDESIFQFANITRHCLRTVIRTLDLHHFSMRMPHFTLRPDDLDLQINNHLESLVLDTKIPVTFHTQLMRLFSANILLHLRKLILIVDQHFQLTHLLLDYFSTLEIVEILSINYHLDRPTLLYLESIFKPTNFRNLHTFRLWIGSVVALHLLKRLHKNVSLSFINIRPGLIFDVRLCNSTTRTAFTRKCVLYDNTHEFHRHFYSVSNTSDNQLSLNYPNYLNYKLLYSEHTFDR